MLKVYLIKTVIRRSPKINNLNRPHNVKLLVINNFMKVN